MTQITVEAPYRPSVWRGDLVETFDQWKLERFVVPPPARIQAVVDRDRDGDDGSR